MKNRIYITTQDKQRLEDLLTEAAIFDARHRGDLKSLSEELQRAVIVDPKEIPDDVVTMNSRAAMIDLDTRETITLTLVFPPEADIDEDKISGTRADRRWDAGISRWRQV